MPEPVEFTVDGATLRAAAGTSLAAAMLDAGITTVRHSRGGAPRGPVCGMGICFECRVTIDGVAHRRACLELVRPGMAVRTGE